MKFVCSSKVLEETGVAVLCVSGHPPKIGRGGAAAEAAAEAAAKDAAAENAAAAGTKMQVGATTRRGAVYLDRRDER